MTKRIGFTLLILLVILFTNMLRGYTSQSAESTADILSPQASIGGFDIVPSEMTFTGDITVCGALTNDPGVEALCSGAPDGSIILGVDPHSADPATWGAASAQAQQIFPTVSSPTVVVITVTWSGSALGHGIFAPVIGKTVSITWDGVTVWSKTTRDSFGSNRFYAARERDIITTAVVTSSGPFQLKLSVPGNTAWNIDSIHIRLYPMPDHKQQGELRGVAYSPFRNCQNPNWGPFPAEAEVREDLARLSHTSNGIRTYSTLNINGQIPRLASEYGIPVCAGAWLGREKDKDGKPVANKNREEIEALVSLANDPTLNLDCLVVGNEVILRGDLTEAELIGYIREVKSRTSGIPVTTAEIGDYFIAYPKLVAEVDLLLAYIYPYWYGQSIDQAVTWLIDRYHAVEAAYPNKRVIIGETGWPTSGPLRVNAQPSIEFHERFFREFVAAAEKNQIDYYYFSAFDEMWKREGGVGDHWGYLYSNRTGKHELQSVLIPGGEIFNKNIFLPLLQRAANLAQSSTDSLFGQFPGLNPPKDILPTLSDELTPGGQDFWVFQNYVSDENHFIPSGWMGDQGDLTFYECEPAGLDSDETSIRVGYTPQGGQGWAGIYWQEPSGNWGTISGSGYNLDNAATLRFTARGAAGGEKVRFLMGGIWGAYPDSQQPALDTDVITLTNAWQEYSIDLRGRNLSQVIGGFAFAVDRCLDPQPVTFYIDNIRYELSGDPGLPVPTPAPSTPYTFDIYRNKDQPGNHYTPSGAMGDVGDVTLNECWRTLTHEGSTAIRVVYSALGQGPSVGCSGVQPCGWASVYWQDPANNWGSIPGGYNLSSAVGISFWARGEQGGELLTFRAGGMSCGNVSFPETFCPAQSLDPAPVTLTGDWQLYTIPFKPGTDLSRVMGPFVWAISKQDNPSGAVFYLDDIQYLFNVTLPPQAHSIYNGPRLADGYDMGVNSSGGQTGWVTDFNGYMCANYPSGQQWGSIFITYGPPVPQPRPGRDLSVFSTLSLELRGQAGGEKVWIGLKDNADPDNGTETMLAATLTNTWASYTFPLSSFTTADLTRLYVVTGLNFIATPAESVCFRNIRYQP